MSAVIGPAHLRGIIAVGIPPFHVVVHMRERPRDFIVIIPITNYGNERLRRLIVREVVRALKPVLRSIVGVGCPSIIFAEVFRLVVNLPVPAVGGQCSHLSDEDAERIACALAAIADYLRVL